MQWCPLIVLLVTHIAFVKQFVGVRKEVFGEMLATHKALLADTALVRLVGAPVQELVAVQVAFEAKAHSAKFARKLLLLGWCFRLRLDIIIDFDASIFWFFNTKVEK